MKLRAVALTFALSIFVAAPAFAESIALRCFCQQLDTQRKAEAQISHGTYDGVPDIALPITTWPDIGQVDTCISTTLGITPDAADNALQEERRVGALQGDDGVALCSAAGYAVDETPPEPAGPAVMQAARDATCKMMTEAAKDSKFFAGETPEQVHAQIQANKAADARTDHQRDAAFATQVGVSQQVAAAAIDRAAAESLAGKFKCP
jgi:hypothetical protein